MKPLSILTALRDRLRQIPLDAESDPAGAPLFEAVELAANKQLGRQLAELLVAKKRACLVVPLRLTREVDDRDSGVAVLGTKVAEVALVYSDVAYFKSTNAVTFGSDKNISLFEMDELIESAVTGCELSPFGSIVLGDSEPLLLSESEQRDAPGRSAWVVEAFVPVGLIDRPAA